MCMLHFPALDVQFYTTFCKMFALNLSCRSLVSLKESFTSSKTQACFRLCDDEFSISVDPWRNTSSFRLSQTFNINTSGNTLNTSCCHQDRGTSLFSSHLLTYRRFGVDVGRAKPFSSQHAKARAPFVLSWRSRSRYFSEVEAENHVFCSRVSHRLTAPLCWRPNEYVDYPLSTG